MPIKEKKIKSGRYIWRMFIYGLNSILLLLTLAFAKCLYGVTGEEEMKKLLRSVAGQRVRIDGWFSIAAGIMAAVGLIVFVGILFVLSRFLAYDLRRRNENRRLLAAVGYRRRDIAAYEEGYFLFDIAVSFAAASVLTAIIFYILKDAEVLVMLADALQTKSLVSPDIYLVTGLCLILITALQVLIRVCRDYDDVRGKRR